MVHKIIKRKILFSTSTFLLVAAAQYYFLSNQNFSFEVLSSIITFLSILFGFYITSLAIFVTSQYVSSLYLVIDSNKKEQTLLHTLTQNYKFGLVLILLSLVYFIGVQLFSDASNSDALSFGDLIFIPVIPFLTLNFLYCYFMLTDLINIIIQEGKSRAS